MKKVKIITIVLAIILVTLVSFGGIYIQTQNRMENKVKDYQLGREISKGRLVELIVKSDNDASKKTEENYEIVKNTIEKRLNKLGAEDFTISLNKENGTIRVELAEDDNTNNYAYYLTAPNKVQIKEKDSETEVLNDSMIEKAKYNYVGNADGKYQVYLDIQLTKDGQAKISEISNNYAILANEIDEIEASEKEDENSENSAEENAENKEKATEENVENKENTKKIAVLNVAGTEYDIEKIEKNKLIVKIGSQSTNNTSINNNISKAAELEMLINSGKLPVEYEVQKNRLEYSNITRTEIKYFALAILAIIIIALVILTIKYKTKGLLASISFIGFIALYSLLLRYTNVLISIEGIGAIIIILAINFKMNRDILNKIQRMDMTSEAVKSTYKDMFLKLIPIIIISIVFCFSGWINLSSFGMIMFWGLALIAIYNVVVTKTLLKLKENN